MNSVFVPPIMDASPEVPPIKTSKCPMKNALESDSQGESDMENRIPDLHCFPSVSYLSRGKSSNAAGCHFRSRREPSISLESLDTSTFQISKVVSDQHFRTKLCPFLFGSRQECHKGNDCTYAHSLADLRSRPVLTKTKLCDSYMKGACSDWKCKWAHGRHELRSTSEFYKTALCKYWERSVCYAGDSCRHAHGLLELRPKFFPMKKMASVNGDSDVDKQESFLTSESELSGRVLESPTPYPSYASKKIEKTDTCLLAPPNFGNWTASLAARTELKGSPKMRESVGKSPELHSDTRSDMVISDWMPDDHGVTDTGYGEPLLYSPHSTFTSGSEEYWKSWNAVQSPSTSQEAYASILLKHLHFSRSDSSSNGYNRAHTNFTRHFGTRSEDEEYGDLLECLNPISDHSKDVLRNNFARSVETGDFKNYATLSEKYSSLESDMIGSWSGDFAENLMSILQGGSCTSLHQQAATRLSEPEDASFSLRGIPLEQMKSLRRASFDWR